MVRICFGISLALALAVIVLSLLMGGNPPLGDMPMKPGFATPILALEFAQTQAELDFIRGAAAAALRDHLRTIQYWDQFFPFAYAGMAIALMLALGLRGQRLAWLALGFAVLAIPADWMENNVLNLLIADAEAGEASSDRRLRALHAHTWIKWAAIAVYGWLSGLVLWLDRHRIEALMVWPGVLAIVIVWVTDSSGLAAEVMSVLMIPFMLAFPVAAIRYLAQK